MEQNINIDKEFETRCCAKYIECVKQIDEIEKKINTLKEKKITFDKEGTLSKYDELELDINNIKKKINDNNCDKIEELLNSIDKLLDKDIKLLSEQKLLPKEEMIKEKTITEVIFSPAKENLLEIEEKKLTDDFPKEEVKLIEQKAIIQPSDKDNKGKEDVKIETQISDIGEQDDVSKQLLDFHKFKLVEFAFLDIFDIEKKNIGDEVNINNFIESLTTQLNELIDNNKEKYTLKYINNNFDKVKNELVELIKKTNKNDINTIKQSLSENENYKKSIEKNKKKNEFENKLFSDKKCKDEQKKQKLNVILLGKTKAGKSVFIKTLSDNNYISPVMTLASKTKYISSKNIMIGDKCISFFDTPGLADQGKQTGDIELTNEMILKMLELYMEDNKPDLILFFLVFLLALIAKTSNQLKHTMIN